MFLSLLHIIMVTVNTKIVTSEILDALLNSGNIMLSDNQQFLFMFMLKNVLRQSECPW